MKERKIIHLDMDAFFAAIEERDDPSLKGKPVIVGSPPSVRGVVSTCNYIARKYGVHSAMSSSEAYRRCPNAVFVKPHFAKYKEASDIVHSIMSEYTEQIEFVALDEGYMDVTGSEFLFGSAEKIALELQERVFKAVGTTCSVGVGYSMMSAKCASEEKKPNGFFVIGTKEEFCKLMFKRPVGELYGIGNKTAEGLNKIGIKTVGDLANTSDEALKKFKNMGVDMKRHALGIDEREVKAREVQKSIGKETTFLKDTSDKKLLTDTLVILANNISYRLFNNNCWCRTVTLKIKYSDLKSITRSMSGSPIRGAGDIYKRVDEIFNKIVLKKDIRLIGISTSNFTDNPYEQISMTDEPLDKKAESLNNTIFSIKNKYGINSLKTAREMDAEKRVFKSFDDI